MCPGVIALHCTSMWFENTDEAYDDGIKMMEVDENIKCMVPPDEITVHHACAINTRACAINTRALIEVEDTEFEWCLI